MRHQQDTCTFLACSVHLGHRAVEANISRCSLGGALHGGFFKMLSLGVYGRKEIFSLAKYTLYMMVFTIQYFQPGRPPLKALPHVTISSTISSTMSALTLSSQR